MLIYILMSDNIFICKICDGAFYLEDKHKKYNRCLTCHRQQEKSKRQNKSDEEKERKKEQTRLFRAKHKDEINKKNREKRLIECGMSEDEIKYVNEKFDLLVNIKNLSYGSNFSLTAKRKRWLLNEWQPMLKPLELDQINYDDTIYNIRCLPSSSTTA